MTPGSLDLVKLYPGRNPSADAKSDPSTLLPRPVVVQLGYWLRVCLAWDLFDVGLQEINQGQLSVNATSVHTDVTYQDLQNAVTP